MYFVKGLLIIAILLFCSIEVGKLWSKTGNYLEDALLGFATMMAVFNVFCVPMHILEIRFTVLCVVFSVLLIAAVLVSLVLSVKRKRRETLFQYRVSFQLFALLAVILIAYQIWRLVVMEPAIYGDDTTYIAMINDIKNSDHIQGYGVWSGIESAPYSPKYIMTSYYPFLAYWCKIFDFHPLLFCKTFYPILTTLFAYGVFWLLAERFFREDMRKKGIFLFLVTLFVEFENISYHFFSRKVLQWPWQSKSVLYTVLIPLLFYLAIRLMEDGMNARDTALLATVLFANGAASLMGVGFSTIMLGLLGIVMAIQNRRVGIFAKTVVACVPMGALLLIAVEMSQRWQFGI